MRKVKIFDEFFEVYDNGILTSRLSLTTEEYPTVELHISSLEPAADLVVSGNVPQEVTIRQAKLALLHGGYLDRVDEIIANMPGIEGKAARIEWEYAITFKRNSTLVMTLASILLLTEEQLDELFIKAAKFE